MFRVNGEEVHNLTLLGKIVEANESSTSQQYTIDDGTGTVVVKKWVDADDAEGAKQTLAAGQYVRVYGHLRVFQGARNVIAFNMRPVTDFNEITYHFLEVVYCNSHNGARAAAAPKVEAGAAEGTAYAAPAAAAAAAGATATGSCSDQVMAIYNGPQGATDNGAPVGDVVTALNGRFTEAQVRKAVEFLVNEGHLYSTIDDNHYRSTLL